jgi:hypothetical protein
MKERVEKGRRKVRPGCGEEGVTFILKREEALIRDPVGKEQARCDGEEGATRMC